METLCLSQVCIANPPHVFCGICAELLVIVRVFDVHVHTQMLMYQC